MPFLRQGGLFIPTTDNLDLGERLFLLVRLPDDAEPLPVCAVVVWLTPARVHGRLRPGVGVRFVDPDNTLRSRIENCLAEYAGPKVASLTM